ncbi:hypothetical protein [Herpetosiphon giganteus]|uniref:hypothetical protein n=1 Tax=Herpetosiphon giganteus TaxID=2029754 RepID=UPI00195D78D3|nr:hypothetical protein [Herpetosiphon giganteus]MBM7846292.1 hypothetical protein [Herpetosiphon giganteus]
MTTTAISADHPMNEQTIAPSWRTWRDHRDDVWASDVNANSYRGPVDTVAFHAMTTTNTAIRFDLDQSEEPRDE